MSTEEYRAELKASLARLGKKMHRTGRPICQTCYIRPAGLSSRKRDGSYRFRQFDGAHECFECSAKRCGHKQPNFVYRRERVNI